MGLLICQTLSHVLIINFTLIIFIQHSANKLQVYTFKYCNVCIIISLKFQMFSKIKSIFSDKNNPQAFDNNSHSQPSFKHPQVKNGDVSQCPFMNKNKSKQANQKQQAKNQNKSQKQKQNNKDSDTESEPQQKPRGGCPFMVSSGTKKNPNLGIQHQGYDQPYVSKFKYYLSANKINFDLLKKGKKIEPITRYTFDKYPIYLKHTLFYNGDDFKKVRTFECCSRFLAYQELRQKGNKKFNKGKYLKALDFYERAMSLFRWLQFQQNSNNSQINSQSMIQQSFSHNQISEDGSMTKIPINLNNTQQQANMQTGPKNEQFDEFTEKYKQFFIVYHDDNVASFDGQQMTETVDVDMRKSLLIQLYLNMAAAYLKLNNFSLANQVLDDAFRLSDKVSQVYLRKAQVALCNKSSTVEQLEKGYGYIKAAIQMQPNEKIFQNTNPNILKMVNIHDAKQVYGQVCKKLEIKIQQQKAKNDQIRQQIQDRLVHIKRIQQQIIREGKQPQQGRDCSLLSQGIDYKVLKRIHDKYVRVMQFYIEAKDQKQVELAKKQFQQILRAQFQMQRISSIQVQSSDPQYGGNIAKVQNRIRNIKKQKCEQISNSVKYNFSVLEWAMKEVVNQQHEQAMRKKKYEEQLKKAEAEANSSHGDQVKQKPNLLSKLPYAMIVIPVIGIIANYLI